MLRLKAQIDEQSCHNLDFTNQAPALEAVNDNGSTMLKEQSIKSWTSHDDRYSRPNSCGHPMQEKCTYKTGVGILQKDCTAKR